MEHSSVPNFPIGTKRFRPNEGQLLRVKVVKPGIPYRTSKRDPVSKAFSVDGTLTEYTVFIEANPEVYLNKGDVLEVEVREVHDSYSRARALRRIKTHDTKTETVPSSAEKPRPAHQVDGSNDNPARQESDTDAVVQVVTLQRIE